MSIRQKAEIIYPQDMSLQDAYIKGSSFVIDEIKNILANTSGDMIFLRSNINSLLSTLEEEHKGETPKTAAWHSVNEVPEMYKLIFCCIEPDVKYLTLHTPSRDKWKDCVEQYNIKRWSYENIMYSI